MMELGDDQSKEITTSILKIRGKTLVFENSVYQISNISSVSLVNLSTRESMPSYFIWMLVIDGVLLVIPIDNIRILGAVVLAAIVIWLFFDYRKSKIKNNYGIDLGLNSGEKTILLWDNYDFIVQVLLTINNIMNTEELNAINVNFDQRQIYEEQLVSIEEMTASSVISGNVQGDVVSNL